MNQRQISQKQRIKNLEAERDAILADARKFYRVADHNYKVTEMQKAQSKFLAGVSFLSLAFLSAVMVAMIALNSAKGAV